jgi:ATP-dependent RNA helicase RhlE
VLARIPKPKQIFFFSATMPAPIEALTREILREPAKVALQRGPAPSAGVTQAVYPVPTTLKAQLLVHMLRTNQMDEALVFTRTKHRADRLAKLLTREGIVADRIHGNRSQAQRTRALADFKAGRIRVLVATDIASRGIDVEALGHVVNFDVPVVPEDYVHRVGRTARAGATGEAFTFAAPEDGADIARIERAIGSKLPRVRLEGFAYEAASDAPLEIPRETRVAAMRAQRASHRAKAAAKSGADGGGTNERKGPRRRRFGKRRGG